MPMWVDVDYAREEWPDAPAADDRLVRYLAAAQAQCRAFLNVPDVALTVDAVAALQGVDVDNLRLAVVFQAREVRSAGAESDGSDVIGVGDYAVRRRPLTMTVRQLLRPKSGIGPIG